MIYKGDVVKLLTPIQHFGTKELLYIGTIVDFKNRFNPFKETKVIVNICDTLSDDDKTYSAYLKEFNKNEIIKIKE